MASTLKERFSPKTNDSISWINDDYRALSQPNQTGKLKRPWVIVFWEIRLYQLSAMSLAWDEERRLFYGGLV